jgi:ArsR family transcriptional regulator
MNTDTLTAEYLSALAHPNRLRIVEFLRDGERCSCEIQPTLGIEQSNLSRHIKVLVQAGVIASRRDGPRMLLSIPDPAVHKLVETARAIVQHRLKTQSSTLRKLVHE